MHSDVDAHHPHALIPVQPEHVKAAVAHGSLEVQADDTHFQSLHVEPVGPELDPVRQELVVWQ